MDFAPMIATPLTPRVRKLLLMAAAVFLVAALILFSFGPFSVGAIESRLEREANLALAERGHDWASVRMNGQVARLTGASPGEADRVDALETVAGSTWAGGLIAGGVTRVEDETVEARLERGFVFRADVAVNGRVLIRGDATDADAREAIARYAEENFPNGADTDLTLVPGGATSPDWETAARRLLGQLARLERGAVVLQGNQGALVGEAANPQIAQSVSGALTSMPLPFSAATLITPAGAPPVSRIPDVAACDTVIRAAQGTEVLRFERDGAATSPLTSVALRRIGRAFDACPDTALLSVTVQRTANNPGLDQDRAGSVRTLLADGSPGDERIAVDLAADDRPAISFSVTTIED